ncbi:MAG: ABC transporter permease subunit [Clostridia bacterium]|nr:ABC transporter permease subunit [Clostridia bacterium]MBQ7913691.1 ABC transporter permease subunit [Clostridia bacterium]
MQKNWLKRVFGRTVSALKRIWRWIKRAVFGCGKELLSLDKESLETPSRRLRAVFFSKKGAVVALVTLAALVLFTFIAPLFVRLDVNYTDPLQQNLAPGYSLRAVPRKLKKSVAFIDGFSGFTLGVDKNGKLYVWGETKDRLTKTNLKKIPDAVQKEGVAFAAAGKDHILAITKTGKIIGWGDDSRGQFGTQTILNALPMPSELVGGVNPDEVACLSCGYQASALVLKSGRAYVWGNVNAVKNLADFQNAEGIEKIVFTGSAAVALTKEGKISTGKEDIFHAAVSSQNGRQNSFNSYMVGRKALEIATDNKCVALVCDGGELVVAGAFENGEDILPTLKEGERLVKLDGGTRHFVGITDEGRAYAWGHNAYGQCTLKNGKCASVFAGAMQTYTLNTAGNLQESAGLKGYLFGTDGRGRDVFARIIHGGKMTLTIGGVAVVVSSAIAILVGCIAGYFGGAVDTLLMRVTEIFSSMPFLPFAMLLSQIIKNYNIGETARIFIIMLILGALSWTGLARMIRGQVLAEREKEFVLAARAMGISEGKIAFRHVLPNVLSVILVSMTLDFASCLLTESSLSYLGFGVQPPRPTWGNMLSGSNNSTVIQNYWWQWLFPALFLSLAVICINVIGDALRDCFDAKRE